MRVGCSRRPAERGGASSFGPAVLAILLLAAGWTACGGREAPDTGPVGPAGPGRTAVPVNQVVTPAGHEVPLPGLRPQALALSPDGRLLAVSGKTSELVIIDPAAGVVLQRVGLPAEGPAEGAPEAASPNILEPDTKGQLSYTGLVFSPDGRRLYLSNVNGSIKVFDVDARRRRQPAALAPAARGRRARAGTRRSRPGWPSQPTAAGSTSAATSPTACSSSTPRRASSSGPSTSGVAPYDVVLVGSKAYVSNWGGRRPGPGDLTGPAGRGTEVRVDAATRIACEGSVSVIDLDRRRRGRGHRRPPPLLGPGPLARRPVPRLRQRRRATT